MPKEKHSKNKENNPPGNPSLRASWNANCDAILLECLERQKENGKMTSNSSWHTSAWVEAEICLSGTELNSGGCKKSATSCQNRWTALKKDYSQVKELRDKSGFGWDEGLGRVTATDEVWNELLKSQPKLGRWRKAPFPLYDTMHELVVGTVATGEGAFCPGRDFTPEAGTNSSDASSPVRPDLSQDLEDTEDTEDTQEITTSSPQGPRQPLAPVTPAQQGNNGETSRKRPAQDIEDTSLSTSKRRGRKPTAGHAITDVASSVRELATAFTTSMNPTSTSTPEREKAIRAVEEDDDLSDNEQIKAFRLFRKNSTIAQTYISISKKAKRTAYIQAEMEEDLIL